MNSLIKSLISKFKKAEAMSQELFKFSWIIENVTAWDHDRRIESPCFVVKELGNAAFYIVWNEKGKTQEKCSMFLQRRKRDETPEEVKLRFCAKVPNVSTSYMTDGDVVIGAEGGRGWHDWMDKNMILQNDAWSLLSGEVRIECTILKPEIGEDVPNGRASEGLHRCVECSARTRLKTKTVSVRWNVRHFGGLRNGDRESVEIFLPSEDSPRFLVTLLLTDRTYETGTVEMNVSNLRELDADPTFVACKVVFGEEERTGIVKIDKHVFDSENAYTTWKLPVCIRKQLVVKGLVIPQDDVLPILLEFKVEEGFEISRIEKASCELDSCSKKPRLKRIRNNPELSSTKRNYQTLLRDQKLCDVLLQTPTKSIGAHKAILCANSPVFAGMFEHETLEKTTSVVQVSVVGFETLERFLRCLYIEGLEDDLDVVEATDLYLAADYYQADSLKIQCSRFLADNLRVENLCDVLSLADRHQDKDLVDSVRVFVRRSRSLVLDSEEWKRLSAERPQLVIETLQCL